LIAELFK